MNSYTFVDHDDNGGVSVYLAESINEVVRFFLEEERACSHTLSEKDTKIIIEVETTDWKSGKTTKKEKTFSYEVRTDVKKGLVGDY
jgi:hypothetical protein